MIIASICTIPSRKNAFQKIVRRILLEQTRMVDRLHVFLNGYDSLHGDLPRIDERIVYHLEPSNPGPWIRYSVVDECSDDDIFITLDDDLLYPMNYVVAGVTELVNLGKTSVSYGGFLYDPFVNKFDYGRKRWHFALNGSSQTHRRISLLMGGVSFHWARNIRRGINLAFSDLRTNDDMMISYHLQKCGIPVLLCPKPSEWIGEMKESRSEDALFRRDAQTRSRAFKRLVNEFEFDPTSGCLDEFLAKDNRIVITLKESYKSVKLHNFIICGQKGSDSSVHVLTSVLASQEHLLQQYVDVPYYIHPVTVPDTGGRCESLLPVRLWRNWRIERIAKQNWNNRLTLIRAMLLPTEFKDQG